MCRNGNSSSSAAPEWCTINHQTELVIGCGRNVYKPIILTAEVLTGCSGLLFPLCCLRGVPVCWDSGDTALLTEPLFVLYRQGKNIWLGMLRCFSFPF